MTYIVHHNSLVFVFFGAGGMVLQVCWTMYTSPLVFWDVHKSRRYKRNEKGQRRGPRSGREEDFSFCEDTIDRLVLRVCARGHWVESLWDIFPSGTDCITVALRCRQFEDRYAPLEGFEDLGGGELFWCGKEWRAAIT